MIERLFNVLSLQIERRFNKDYLIKNVLYIRKKELRKKRNRKKERTKER